MPRRIERVHLDVVHAANGGLRAALDSTGETGPFLCECSDATCARTVELTAAGYDDVRLAADPRVLHPVCAARGAAVPDPSRATLVARGRWLRRLLRLEP